MICLCRNFHPHALAPLYASICVLYKHTTHSNAYYMPHSNTVNTAITTNTNVIDANKAYILMIMYKDYKVYTFAYIIAHTKRKGYKTVYIQLFINIKIAPAVGGYG